MRKRGFPLSLRAACCLLAAVLLLSLSACSGGLPSTAESAKETILSLGFPNELIYETYDSPNEYGKQAVLLYMDADAQSYFQAILFDTEAHAKAVYAAFLDDDLLMDAFEDDERFLETAGNWVLIGPEQSVRAFAGSSGQTEPHA